MSRKLTVIVITGAVLLALALFAGLVWANTVFARQNPGETDFLVPWLAARTYLQYGDSPYSTAATQRAQIVYYGRLAGEGEDPLRLWLPFPLVVLYLPFALIPDYALARGLWVTVLEIALVGLAWLALRSRDWKPGRWTTLLLLLFAPLWFHGLYSIFRADSLALAAASLAGCLLAFHAGRDELAGALLILPLFHPVSTSLVAVLLLWWTLRQRRYRFLAGFVMALVLLFGISLLFLSDWFVPFLSGAIVRAQYNPGMTLAGLLSNLWPAVGPRIAWVVAGLTGIVLLLEWLQSRGKEPAHLLWTASLTLALAPLLGFSLRPENIIFQILPLYLILSVVESRWPQSNGLRWSVLILAVYLVLGWTAVLALSGQRSGGVQLGLLFFLLPFVHAIGLYWVRWWAIRPPRTWWDRLE